MLQVSGLKIAFGAGEHAVAAVRDVSFEIQPGEMVGLVGESGCGKSLTCRAAIRLLPHGARIAAGSVLFEGRDVIGMDNACAAPASVARSRDDLSRSLHLVESGVPGRRPGRGDPARQSRPGGTRKRNAKPSACSAEAGFPIPSAGAAPFRTNSAAGCASA